MMALKVDRLACPDVPSVDPRAWALLNHLRLIALQCRSAARADLFEACAVLSHDRSIARAAHAETLMKCLSQATGNRPRMLRPGSEEVSFDEAWLARLATASLDEDHDSFRFLLQSRVPKSAQRNVAFLIHAISRAFCRA